MLPIIGSAHVYQHSPYVPAAAAAAAAVLLPLRVQLHALGFMEGHEGSQSLRVKFYLTDDSQAGRGEQLDR
jgi:hypothetical protein